jgi:hypothetical protein
MATAICTYIMGVVVELSRITTDPSYMGGRDRRITVKGQPRQKLVRLYVMNKLGMVVYTCGFSYSECRHRRIAVQGQPAKA